MDGADEVVPPAATKVVFVPASVRGMSEAELVGSVRQAASASGVSPFVVRRWISQGLLAEPPWTLEQLHAVRDAQDPSPRSQAPHGTTARWNDGCSCAVCRGAHNDNARVRKGTKAHGHGTYAEAVIELEHATDTVPALVAASSDAAAALGLGRSKGRLRRGYDADVLVVGGDLAADLTALRDVRQVVLRGVPVSPRSGQA